MLKTNFGICDKELRSVSFGSMIKRHQGLPKEYYDAPKCVYEDKCYIINVSNKIIEEGLIKTYPTEFLIKKIIQVVHNNGVVLTKEHFEIEEPNDDNSISGIIMFGIPFAYASKKLHDELNQCFNLCGYYCSQMVYEDEAKLVLFQVEPKFQTKKTQPTLGRYIYHITTKAAASKIIKNGFFPKRATKSELGYDPRIFFFTINSKDFFLQYMKMARKENINADGTKDKQFVVLTVDRNVIGDDVKFFHDPNIPYQFAIYTYENIPPQAIVSVENIVGY